jgi:GNAT superfamily N-acetyltransferase
MPVTLSRITAGNPFADFPLLRTIFVGDRAAHVEADTLGDLAKGNAAPFRNQIYLIRDARGAVVGLTGLFCPYGDAGSRHETLALRWHGIAPEHRGKGYSMAAFHAVCDVARRTFPAAHSLIELVPMADQANGDKLVRYFGALGFEADGPVRDAAEFPASAALPPDSGGWQPMRFFLQQPEGQAPK